MALDIPLKLKYRESKPSGNKSKGGTNPAVAKKGSEGSGVRRRSYGPWWWHKWGSQLPVNPRGIGHHTEYYAGRMNQGEADNVWPS